MLSNSRMETWRTWYTTAKTYGLSSFMHTGVDTVSVSHPIGFPWLIDSEVKFIHLRSMQWSRLRQDFKSVSDWQDHVKIAAVNCAEQDICSKYFIRGTPTIRTFVPYTPCMWQCSEWTAILIIDFFQFFDMNDNCSWVSWSRHSGKSEARCRVPFCPGC